MNTATKIFVVLAAILIAQQNADAQTPGTDPLDDIPLLPGGVHLGMGEDEFVQQHPAAVLFNGFLPKQDPEEITNKTQAIYIESEMDAVQRSAVTYQFDEGLCSAISFEEYFPSVGYATMRENVLNTFFQKYGAASQRWILETREPTKKAKAPSLKRGSPTLEWKMGDSYILLTVTPDEWVSEDGIGKVGLRVVDKMHCDRLELLPPEDEAYDSRFSSIDIAEQRLEGASE